MGAVLAGGASSRFGSDKAMAVWRGRTLLEHARETLAGMVDEVVVVGRGDVPDLPCAGLGPLGGIAGAMAEAARRGFDSVVTTPCDMVGLPEGLLAALLRQAPSYCADAPVLGHWPVRLATMLSDRLASLQSSLRPCAAPLPIVGTANESGMPDQVRHDAEKSDIVFYPRDAALSVRRWAIDIAATAIPSPAPIVNVNTAADLAAL